MAGTQACANTPDGRDVTVGGPDELHTDKGYDYPCLRYLHRRGIGVRIARRGIEGLHSPRTGPLGRRAHGAAR